MWSVSPGFVVREHENKVCLLKKVLYGLKQPPRAWFERFSRALIKFGFTRCHADHTIPVKRKNKKVVILVV